MSKAIRREVVKLRLRKFWLKTIQSILWLSFTNAASAMSPANTARLAPVIKNQFELLATRIIPSHNGLEILEILVKKRSKMFKPRIRVRKILTNLVKP